MLAPRHKTTDAVAWAESANEPDMHLASTSPAPLSAKASLPLSQWC